MSKGAFPFTGTCMSKSKSGLTGSGKMSSAHGLNSGNKHKGVRNAGPTTIGTGTRTFRSGPKPAGTPFNEASHHGKQPKGHGK